MVGVVVASKAGNVGTYFGKRLHDMTPCASFEYVCIAYDSGGGPLKSLAGIRFKKYGTVCKEGDVVGMDLDLNKGTLAFTVNGQDQGVAFEDIATDQEYRLAVSLTGNGNTMQIISYQPFD